jgi:hypothetical protein
MSSNVGKKCFKLWCVLCAVQCVCFLTILIKPQCVLLQLGDINQEWKSDL